MKETLLKQAKNALQNAYAPYSSFFVATALECADGSIFTGVNIQNASYGATLCAERSAFAAAITQGKRDFVRILIIGGKGGEITDFCPPCGICRQVMGEFCKKEFEIILYNGKDYHIYTLTQLLPEGFRL